VDEFDRGGQMDVIGAIVATQFRRRQCQHRAQAFAAGLDQMGGDFGDARGVL